MNAVDMGHEVFSVFFDLSKAFDKVPMDKWITIYLIVLNLWFYRILETLNLLPVVVKYGRGQT